jgi:hypothetical protein
MQNAIILDRLAVLVRHWFEIDPDVTEHGARVELRVLERHPHQGSESASQVLTLGRPILRADLFDLIGPPPGNMARAHYHVVFDGYEPVTRQWDDALGENPLGWLRTQLRDMSPTLTQAGLSPDDSAAAAASLAASAAEIVRLAALNVGAECRSAQQCLDLTSDTTDAIGIMLSRFRPGTSDPRLAHV